MKKILFTVLISFLLLGLMACGEKEEPVTVEQVKVEDVPAYTGSGSLPTSKEEAMAATESRSDAIAIASEAVSNSSSIGSMLSIMKSKIKTATRAITDNSAIDGSKIDIVITDEEIDLSTDSSSDLTGTVVFDAYILGNLNQTENETDSSYSASISADMDAEANMALTDVSDNTTTLNGNINAAARGSFSVSMTDTPTSFSGSINFSAQLAYSEGISISGDTWVGKYLYNFTCSFNLYKSAAEIDNMTDAELDALIEDSISISGSLDVYDADNTLQFSAALTEEDIINLVDENLLNEISFLLYLF